MKRSGQWWEITFIPSSDANRLATPETLWQKVPLFAPDGFLKLPGRWKCCCSSGVEHVLGKDGVGGSIPLNSTTFSTTSSVLRVLVRQHDDPVRLALHQPFGPQVACRQILPHENGPAA